MTERLAIFPIFAFLALVLAAPAQAGVKACDLLLDRLAADGEWYQVTVRDTTRVFAECTDVGRPEITGCLVVGQAGAGSRREHNVAFLTEASPGYPESTNFSGYYTPRSKTEIHYRDVYAQESVTAGPDNQWNRNGRRSTVELDFSSNHLFYRVESTREADRLIGMMIPWTVQRNSVFRCTVAANRGAGQ